MKDDFRPGTPGQASSKRPAFIKRHGVRTPINQGQPSPRPPQPFAESEGVKPPVALTPERPSVVHQPETDRVDPERANAPKKRWWIWIIIVLLLMAMACAAVGGWYAHVTRPIAGKSSAKTEQIKIVSGTTPQQIAQLLRKKQLIRSELGFMAYTRLHNVRGQLQAGSYIISSSESMKEIVGHLVSGRVEEYSVTFYPGAALNSSASSDKTLTHRQVLKKVGFNDEDITRAFAAQYNHPLVADKPASVDIEGYIYGDTYQIAAGSTAEEVITKTFDEFYAKLQANSLIEPLMERNGSLYKALTLGSIVQKESGGDDKPQIAQVFYTRLSKGMNLGSDVTYQYAADKAGVARDTELDSPYNTRRYGGLPPGPIASPGIDAMKAVAAPAAGDYVYFLSGDDDVTYYARTEEEHNKNITDHCQKKCQIL